MFLKNTNTYASLANGMNETAEQVILDVCAKGMYKVTFPVRLLTTSIAAWVEVDDLFVMCTVPLRRALVRPKHDHNLPFSSVPDDLVPVFLYR